MRLIYYSLALVNDSVCERQWLRSIRSLRKYNKQIAVHLFVYNAPTPLLVREAHDQHVNVHLMGPYSGCFQDCPLAWTEVLNQYPVLHKLYSLRQCATAGTSQILYVDCDTFFFGDVEDLFEKYSSCDWYAREEPFSRRSHFGYDPSHIDEDALLQLAKNAKVTEIPPYNLGVIMFNRGIWHSIRFLYDGFVTRVWKFLVWIAFNPDRVEISTDLSRLIREIASDSDKVSCLQYPSTNAWIVEEIALWLTLGEQTQFSHQCFERQDVIQGGEYVEQLAQKPTYIVAHYFSWLETRYFADVDT